MYRRQTGGFHRFLQVSGLDGLKFDKKSGAELN